MRAMQKTVVAIQARMTRQTILPNKNMASLRLAHAVCYSLTAHCFHSNKKLSLLQYALLKTSHLNKTYIKCAKKRIYGCSEMKVHLVVLEMLLPMLGAYTVCPSYVLASFVLSFLLCDLCKANGLYYCFCDSYSGFLQQNEK